MILGPSDRDAEPCTSSVSQPICSDVSRESPPSAPCSSRLAATNTAAASSHQDSSVQEPLPDCQPCHDIGGLLNPANSITENCRSVGELSNAEKYSFLYHHVQPPKILPSIFPHGCNRKFNISWLEKYSWLQYSPKLDGVFCAPCALLLSEGSRRDKGLLVNRPFSNWVKLSDVLSNHSKSVYHREAVQSADVLKSTVENPASRIDVMTNHTLQARIAQNKHILQVIVRSILFLAKQGLPFRGDKEDVNSEKNPGNFLALMKLFAENDTVLRDHLYQPRARNVTYLSPR